MSSQDHNQTSIDERLIKGYENLLERAEQTLTSAVDKTEGELIKGLNAARERAIELGELTREEADKLHDFVTRDLYAAGRHLTEEERDITDWLRLNALLVEKTLLHRFTQLSQAAKLELNHLKKAKQRLDEWHTGEITTIGTLSCRSCGELLHFKHVGHIPPCPKCHATIFDRAHDR